MKIGNKSGLKYFGYEDIKSWKPCFDPGKVIPTTWRGTAVDILSLKNVSASDRLWVVLRTDLVSEKCMRLFAVWSARQVQHLMTDPRSLEALNVAERFAKGEATQEELEVAAAVAAVAAEAAAAWAAAVAVAAAAAAAWAAAAWAAEAAAEAAAAAAAWAAAGAQDAQIEKLIEMIQVEGKQRRIK